MNTWRIVYMVVFIWLVFSCTKNEIIVIDNRPDIDSAYNDDVLIKGENIVNFSPQVYNSYVNTGYVSSEMQPFAKGNKAQIFVCVYGGGFISWPMYQALSAGTLSPIEEPVVVVNGLYDFYFVSVNSPDDPPVMRYSEVSPVNNGVDYVWCKVHTQIEANNTSVPVLFTHSTAQIVIQINNLDSPGIVDWTSYAMLQVPDTTNIVWGLYDGVLSQTIDDKKVPAQALSADKMVMSSSALTSTLCVLPLQYEGSMEAYLSLRMRDVTTSDSITGYNISLDIPDNELVAGTSYHYTVNFGRDTIYVGDVEIDSWIAVDLEGNPLYPDITKDN